MIYAYTTFGLLVLFPGVFFHSRVTGACPVTTDLIIRVNVRTTKTKTAWTPEDWYTLYCVLSTTEIMTADHHSSMNTLVVTFQRQGKAAEHARLDSCENDAPRRRCIFAKGLHPQQCIYLVVYRR